MARLLVIGAGGYGRAVAELALLAGEHTLAGFVDDRWPDLAPVSGVPVVGRLADLAALRPLADAVIPAIGDNSARRRACESAVAAGFNPVSLVHPRATVSSSAAIGAGVTVMAGAVIGTEARIDDGVVVNAGAVVDHHAHVGAYGHLGAGACMGGGSVLEPGAKLAAGEALQPGQRQRAGEMPKPSHI